MTRKKNKHMCNKTKSMIEEEKRAEMLREFDAAITEKIENENTGETPIENTDFYMRASEIANRYLHFVDKFEIQEMYDAAKAKMYELNSVGDFKWSDDLCIPDFIRFIHEDNEEPDKVFKICNFIGFFVRDVFTLSAERNNVRYCYDVISMYYRSEGWLDFIVLNMSEYLSESAYKKFKNLIEKYKTYYKSMTSKEYFQAFLNI